jgi:hypothetical protein
MIDALIWKISYEQDQADELENESSWFQHNFVC